MIPIALEKKSDLNTVMISDYAADIFSVRAPQLESPVLPTGDLLCRQPHTPRLVPTAKMIRSTRNTAKSM